MVSAKFLPGRFHLVEEMTDGGEGMEEEHPGTDVAHDGLHLLAARGRVTVDRAFPAAWFAVAVRTLVEPLAGIL